MTETGPIEPPAPETALHLAQINVGRLLHDKEAPEVAEFMDNLALINGVAERSPGYVWRFTDEGGVAATDVSFDGDDPRFIANLTVWESAEALEHFVWNTVHKRFYRKKAAWFETLNDPHFAMWWIPAGARPTLAEAKERLDYLKAHGPTAYAFGWESLPNVQAWRAERCA